MKTKTKIPPIDRYAPRRWQATKQARERLDRLNDGENKDAKVRNKKTGKIVKTTDDGANDDLIGQKYYCINCGSGCDLSTHRCWFLGGTQGEYSKSKERQRKYRNQIYWFIIGTIVVVFLYCIIKG